MATKPERSSGLRDYVGIVRRRSVHILSIAPPVLFLFVFLAFWIKPQYQATATILLQSSSVSKEVIQSTIASNTDEQIEQVQGRVLTLDTLTQLVHDYDPYPQDQMSVAQKAQRVLGAVTVEPVDAVTFKPTSDATNAFSIHYTNPNRTPSAEVTGRIAQLFLTYHQRQRVQEAHDTAAFLQQQAAGVSRDIAAVDSELAKLKVSQGDAMPELRAENQASIDRTQRDLDSLQQEILASESKESQLSVQMSQMSPNLISQSGDLTDVATVRARLTEAQQRYTPDHPEVKRLQRALEMLLAQQQKSGASSSGVVASATNPQYIVASTELASTRRQLAALHAQVARDQAKLDGYEELLRRTPGVERTESDILRRRQSLQNQYQQIQDKLQNAEEAQSFEAEQRGERFVLLQAPSVPRTPISPNRPGLIAMGLLLALGLAGTAVAIAESADVNIRNVGDLPDIGAPLLATIPIIRNAQDRNRRRLIVAAVGFAYTIAILAVSSVIATALRH
jgi:succinoglycan biosynthesis transport protein ExoP